MTMDELRDAQVAMEDKVYRIWTVLSAFEGNKITYTTKKVTCGFSFFFTTTTSSITKNFPNLLLTKKKHRNFYFM